MNKNDRAKLKDLHAFLVELEKADSFAYPADDLEAAYEDGRVDGRENAAADARYKLEDLFPEVKE